MKRHLWLIAAASGLLLAGCGDDDDRPAQVPITTTVPATAANTPEDFITAVRQIIAAPDADMLEPSDISAVMASTTATSDDKEPADI